MGNSIGVECSFNGVYVTNILIKEKKKSWEKLEEKSNGSGRLINHSDEQIENRPKDVSHLCANTHTNVKNCKRNKGNETADTTITTTSSSNNNKNCNIRSNSSSSSGNNRNVENKKEVPVSPHNIRKAENGPVFETFYFEMQNLFFEYLAIVHPIIDDSLFLYIIKNDKEKFFDKEFSLKKVFKTSKENSHTEEVKSFAQTLWQMHNGIEKEEKNTEKISEGTCESSRTGEEKVILVYCWSFRRKVLEELLIKSEKLMKDLFLNVTGINMNYIRKKIKKLKKLNMFSNVCNICYHQEMQCTKSCMNFLKCFCPDSFFYFVSINENNKKHEANEQKKISVQSSKRVPLNKCNVQNFSSVQIVNLKSVVSYYRIDKNREITELGNSIIGTATISALWILLTGQKKSFEHILQLAENGNNNRFDMTVGDIYGSNYNLIGLSKDVIASLFGKAQHMDYIKTCFNTLKGNVSEMLLSSESTEENETSENETSENESNYKIGIDSSKHTERCKRNPFCNLPPMISKYEKRKKLFNYHSDTLCTYADKDEAANAKHYPMKRETEMKRQAERKMKIEIKKKKICDESRKDMSEKDSAKKFENPKDIQLGDVQCDLARSLLSLMAISIFQQAYLHCNIHNIKSIVVVSCFSNNTSFALTMQQLINFWSHKTIQLYFVKPTKHFSSLGAALHSLH